MLAPSAFVALLAALVLAQPAAAAITSSNIDSPADPAYVLTDTSGATAFHVHGTAGGPGNVDVDCFNSSGNATVVKSSVPVVAGAFDVDVTTNEASASISAPCVLRAVPAGDPTARPPSATGDPFQGPQLAQTSGLIRKYSGTLYDFDYVNDGLGGEIELESAGGGALNSSRLFAAGTLAPSQALFEGNGYFNGGELLKVDGADSFVVASLVGDPSMVPLQFTKSFDPATGALTIVDREPLLTCETADSSCTTYVPSGVELVRTWTTAGDGHVTTQSDSWRSTDGSSHTLDATYVQGFNAESAAGASFLFPGSSGFQQYAQNATVAMPPGSGSVYVKEDKDTADAGDGTHPQGVVSYASAPDSSALFALVYPGYSEWDAHYVRTVPATGSATLRFSYGQAFALADVQALAQAANASFAPSIAITSPADGSTSPTPNVTVTGTSSDGAGIASVKLNGQAASVGGDGSWSVPVALSPGANQLTAVATDVDGITAQRQITVSYTPPPAQPHLALLGAPRAASGGVTFRVSCSAASCKGSAALTATEILKGQQKLTGVGAKTRRKVVKVGRVSFSLNAGAKKTVTVRLNSLGRKLLKRFKRLPVKLSVSLVPAGGKATAVATKRLTIKAKRPRKH